MCLKAFRRNNYPNKYAYKVVRRTGDNTFRSPYHPSKGQYKIGKTYKANGARHFAIPCIDPKDPRPYEQACQLFNTVIVPSGSHLYTRFADAKRFCNYKNAPLSRGRGSWVILKCDIADVRVYGDDHWGRAVVAMEVTPREVV